MDPTFLLVGIGVLCTCLCSLLAMFLLMAHGPLKSANRFLAGFLLLTAIDVVGWSAAILPTALRELLPYRLPLSYLQMPLLYMYSVALCFPSRSSLPHLLGGCVAAFASLIALVSWTFSGQAAAGLPATAGVVGVVNNLALHLQFYVYILLMAHVLVQYRVAYRRSHSNPDTLTFKWLATVIVVSFLAHTLVLAKNLSWIGGWSGAQSLQVVVAVVAVAITCALTLAALVRQDLFLGVTVEPTGMSGPAASQPAAPSAATASTIARIKSYMEAQEPFLDPSLTIRTLARRLGMGQRELSHIINNHLGVHFFDFVNQYRVGKASAMLVDPTKHHMSVLEIAFQTGFNTKSSFNAAFRKHQGATPSAYRRLAAMPLTGAKAGPIKP